MVRNEAFELNFPEISAGWVVFMHTTDMATPKSDKQGFFPATRGYGLLREHFADYVFLYSDGTERRVPILRQHQIGVMWRPWGINCFEAVAHQKPYALRTRGNRGVKRMRIVITAAHRSLHNRLHHEGTMHDHTPTTNHEEHRRSAAARKRR